MTAPSKDLSSTLARDLMAGTVVFLVALPLCLGIALASGAPLLSGIVAGIIGGVLVGLISGSETSVSGPAAGLAAVVAALIGELGFPAFLMAVIIAGLAQSVLGVGRAGFVAAFIPTSVIKGLLAAIGVLLVLKQVPHLLGHDADPHGDMAFQQPDDANTFSALGRMFGHIHLGAMAIGFSSVALLILWTSYKPLKRSILPAPLAVVLLGVGLGVLFRRFGGLWFVEPASFVQVPLADGIAGFLKLLERPDFSQWNNPRVYTAGLTIAAVASLETLLNLEAVDKIDPQQRSSPPSRELLAQGIGNVVVGLAGGIPITSVIVRSSVNINAGNQTKLSAIVHGVLLFISVVYLPAWLNMIPLSCLAAILLVTGVKLASPALVAQMWREGRYQFVPFAATVVGIVFTDLLTGIIIGLVVSLSFILNSNVRRPIRRFVEKHIGGEVLHIELPNQVSFLNRAALSRVLDAVPGGGHVLLDAQDTDYVDPDVLDMIRDYTKSTAPARDVQVSLRGFRPKYQLRDQIQYVDYSTRELQSAMTPAQVLELLWEGHERFRSGRRLIRDLGRQVTATAAGQHPLAVVLSCIDSRTPTELVFDLGLGDILSVRVAGNIISTEVLGSLEYGCAVAGAKVVLVMGHTRCGAIAAAVDLAGKAQNRAKLNGCEHLEPIIGMIQQSIDQGSYGRTGEQASEDKHAFADCVSRENVRRMVDLIQAKSKPIARLRDEGRVVILGAVYDVATGQIEFLPDSAGRTQFQPVGREMMT